MSRNTVAAPASAPNPHEGVPWMYPTGAVPIPNSGHMRREEPLTAEDLPGHRLPGELGVSAVNWSGQVDPRSPYSERQGRMLLPVVTERSTTSRGRSRPTHERHAAPTQFTQDWHQAQRSPRRRFENGHVQIPFKVNVKRP